jgi:hypothetical protein
MAIRASDLQQFAFQKICRDQSSGKILLFNRISSKDRVRVFAGEKTHFSLYVAGPLSRRTEGLKLTLSHFKF